MGSGPHSPRPRDGAVLFTIASVLFLLPPEEGPERLPDEEREVGAGGMHDDGTDDMYLRSHHSVVTVV